MKKSRLFTIILTLLIQFAGAQDFQFKNFNEENGLHSSNTFQVFQDSKSYIWISSAHGIARYDGYEFEDFRQTSITNNPVWEIIETQSGKLWFITFNGELFYYYGNKICEYKFNKLLKSELKRFKHSNITCVNISDHDEVVITLSNFNNIKIGNNGSIQIEHFKSAEEKYSNLFTKSISFVEMQAISAKYKLWIKGKSSFERSKSNLLKLGEHQMKISENKIFILRKNRVVDVHRYKGDILWISKSKQNEVVVGTRENGVYIYSDFLQKRLKLHLLPNKSVTSYVEDLQQGVWITTIKDGVFYYPNMKIKTLNSKNGLTHDRIDLISATPNGILIPGFNPNYQLFDTKRIVNYNLNIPKRFVKCSGIKQLDGKLFIGYYDTEGEKYGYLYQANSLKWSGAVDFIEAFKQNNDYYYIGTDEFRQLRNYKSIREAWAVDFTKVFDIQKISDTTMLVATNVGLIDYNYKYLKFVKKQIPGFKEDILTNKVQLIDSNIWVGTRMDGIIQMKDSEIIQYDKSCGLLSNRINDFYKDGNILWIASNYGLSKYNLDTKEVVHFNSYNGLVDNKINHIEIFKNHIFLATDKGLSYFDKNIELPSFKMVIESIHINEQKLNSLDSVVSINKSKNLKISYKALSFSTDNNIKYRYKLKGFDTEWHSTTNLHVDYTNLPAGKYSFLIKAINSSNIESDICVIQTLLVEKPLWDYLFPLLIILFISAIGITVITYFILRYRMRIINQKMEMTNKINEYRQQALSAQINPHFLYNSLNSIQNYIAKNDKIKSREYLSKFGVLMRTVLHNSQSSWISLEDELDALQLYIEMEMMRFRNSFSYKFDKTPEIDLAKIKVPPLMIQPYVENAIHHGLRAKHGEKLLKIKLFKENSNTFIEIIDNGIGIEQANQNKTNNLHKSLGTSITEKRIKVFSKIYKSQFSVETLNNVNYLGQTDGTRVRIKIKNN